MSIDDKLFDYFLPHMGVAEGRFVEAHVDASRFIKPYATWQLIGNSQVGEGLTYGVDENGDQVVALNKNYVVQLNFYGADALELADACLTLLQTESALINGDLLNIGLLGTTQAIDTSSVKGDTWERRFSVRVSLSGASETVQHVGLIESVDIESTTTGGATGPISTTLHIEDV